MKRLRLPKIERETYEEQHAAGRFNPGRVLVYKHRRIPLSAGSFDSVCVWTSMTRIIVMAYNKQHGYAGMDEFTLEKKYESKDEGFSFGGSVFFQYDWELPSDFFSWSDSKMCNYLLEFL